MLGDLTFAYIILLSVDMTSIYIYIKSIVCRYDVREREQARISCVLIANQNRASMVTPMYNNNNNNNNNNINNNNNNNNHNHTRLFEILSYPRRQN